MRLQTALVSLLILLCPCALCYGQLRFASVSGDWGYSAIRASYRADMDNGFILIPKYGYYRMSDDEETQDTGSTSRYGLEILYELHDSLQALVEGSWQPDALGYEGAAYRTGFSWEPFYYFAGIKEPRLTVKFGQERFVSKVDWGGYDLDSPFKRVATDILTNMEVNVKRFNLQAAWQKVIKYNSPVPRDVTFTWAELPYMTAVLQGYIKDAYAVRISYVTQFITPYASITRFHYDSTSGTSVAVSAGLHIKLWDADFTGGVEVFEPRRDDERETYFSLSLDVPM